VTPKVRKSRGGWKRFLPPPLLVALLLLTIGAANCRRMTPEERLIPQTMSDVPAQYLAYRFAPDTEPPPEAAAPEEAPAPAVQTNFDTGRPTDALLRTVVSPDGQRVLALYATGDTPQGIFRIDMYAADGKFLRNITAPELACAFTPSVAWSPDGQWFAFIARRNETLLAAPTPAPKAPKSATKKNAPEPEPPVEEAVPTPTLGPRFAPIETYATEQIYLSDRDGFNIRPVTTDEELIFFNFTWAPNGRADAMAALACGEAEWQARVAEGQLPAGRPRLLLMAGGERLLDDRLTEVEPVWSPDASKIATAFENEVTIYDASIKPSTGARIALRDALLEASIRYDAERLQPSATAPPAGETKDAAKKGAKVAPTPTPSPVPVETPAPSVPLSFNSIVRLEWPQVETLYAETGFVRVYANETVSSYLRWHTLNLSPQAILLKRT
jgi:hypothetical protein